jgi:hypothetical protein
MRATREVELRAPRAVAGLAGERLERGPGAGNVRAAPARQEQTRPTEQGLIGVPVFDQAQGFVEAAEEREGVRLLEDEAPHRS